MARTQTQGTAALGTDLRGARMPAVGDEKYLWILVVLEVAALWILRGAFKRHHGG
jgi:hypothetical protein